MLVLSRFLARATSPSVTLVHKDILQGGQDLGSNKDSLVLRHILTLIRGQVSSVHSRVKKINKKSNQDNTTNVFNLLING